MASERTEEATPKRRDKARSEGQISKSQDLNSALVLSAGIGIMFGMVPYIMEEITIMAKNTFANLHPNQISDSPFTALIPYGHVLIKTMLPFLLLLFFTTIIILRKLVGPLFSLQAIKPKLDKLTPAGIFKSAKSKLNPFAPKQLMELAKSIAKLLIVGGTGYAVVMSRKEEIFALLGVPLVAAFSTISSILSNMIINMCLAMILIGYIDKKYQDYEYSKSLKMTKQEIDDERKSSEGDPMIKSKVRAAQMQMMRQQMMQAVEQADVVVTNPTHYAVAIKYDTTVAPAPQVIAKGVDFMAFKIREIAEANKIPIQENKPLARTLYKVVPLDGIVPPELYVAVAELLAFVYNKDRRS